MPKHAPASTWQRQTGLRERRKLRQRIEPLVRSRRRRAPAELDLELHLDATNTDAQAFTQSMLAMAQAGAGADPAAILNDSSFAEPIARIKVQPQ
jgi:hypothetical protein